MQAALRRVESAAKTLGVNAKGRSWDERLFALFDHDALFEALAARPPMALLPHRIRCAEKKLGDAALLLRRLVQWELWASDYYVGTFRLKGLGGSSKPLRRAIEAFWAGATDPPSGPAADPRWITVELLAALAEDRDSVQDEPDAGVLDAERLEGVSDVEEAVRASVDAARATEGTSQVGVGPDQSHVDSNHYQQSW